MKQEIKAGTLSLTKARKLCSVIDAENQAQWLDFAKTFSSKALELGISEECLQKPVDFEGTLSAALDAYLDKCDPVKKEAQRITAKKVKRGRKFFCVTSGC